MDPLTIVDVVSRWLHVGAAIVLLGGSVFMRCVLMPAGKRSLGEAEHNALRTELILRWKKYVMAGIGLLLVTGLYNWLVVGTPAHQGNALYQALMGTKFLLALAVFFLASVLTGRSPRFEGMRQNRSKWLSVLILLAALVVGIAGYLKVAVKGTSSPGPASALHPVGVDEFAAD